MTYIVPLSSHDNPMASIIDTLPFATHIRNLDQDKYVLANLQHAKYLGFQNVDDITNITYTEIARYRKERILSLEGSVELEEAYQYFILQANTKTQSTKTPQRFQVCSLYPTGFIYVNVLHKIPLFNRAGNVNAIFTFAQDITSHFDTKEIYELYRKHFSGKRAIKQFIKHINIEEHFRSLPTHQELLALLTFKKDNRAKYVAKQLGISDRTVEEYKARLRTKLKHCVTLDQVLLKLRSPNTPGHFKPYSLLMPELLWGATEVA